MYDGDNVGSRCERSSRNDKAIYIILIDFTVVYQ